MSRSFRTVRAFLAPSWLTTGDGELVGYSLDLIKDAFVERVRLGLMARLPQNGPDGETAPEDALTAIGQDRKIVRGIGETSRTYAARLLRWLDDHAAKGSAYMLMKQLAGYCGPGVAFRTVDVRGNWYSRDAAGVESAVLKQENWNWDGDLTFSRWSRFWVIIYPNGLWTSDPNDYGDVGLDYNDPGLTYGTSATQDQVAAIKQIVNDWKPAGTRCVNIIIAFDAASFDPSAPEPDGTWERAIKNVDGVLVPSRLGTARYWSGS